MSGGSFETLRFVSLSPLPTWTLALLCGLVVAAVALSWRSVWRERSRGARAAMMALRLLAGVLAIGLLLQPGVRNVEVARVRSRVAVLVDRSASMAFPGGPEGTRAEQVAAYLERVAPALSQLESRFRVELHGFTPELVPLASAELTSEPKGERTDIQAALRQLGAGAQGEGARRLAGVLLFSDGADNGPLDRGIDAAARETLARLGAPVSTFLAGSGDVADLAVARVRADDFAFVRNSIEVEVELRATGLPALDVPLVLRREGEVVATRRVRVTPQEGGVATATFRFTPDRTGRFVYTVAAPVYPDEVVPENNQKSFTLKVIRDRVRVLLVVGRPSWDERFLRERLKQDANVDLVSFYILRTMTDETGAYDEERELSLIPFPTQEIFASKLDTFDVVIFQNFGYADRSLSISMFEPNLERYIRDGGAFVMIGGDASFGEGRASFPVLERALPVSSLGMEADLRPFQPELTAEGALHPITSLGAGRAASRAAWASLPPLKGANVTRAKPEATVLMEHPSRDAVGAPAPILAVWEYGRGRSMALTVDTTWRWAFTAHAEGEPVRHYERFWGNALRWLVRDPELTPLQVDARPSTVEPGEPVGLHINARNSDYTPAPGASVEIQLVRPGEPTPVAQLAGITAEDGTLRLELPAPEAGPYRVLARAQKDGRSLGEAEDVLAVRSGGIERARVAIRPELLEGIAQQTGGRSFTLAGLRGLPDVPLEEPPLVEVGRSDDRPLWDRWWPLAALVVLLGLDWVLRRRLGYI